MNVDRRGGGGGRHGTPGAGAIRCSRLDKDRQTVRRRDAQDAYRSMSGRRRHGLLRILPAKPKPGPDGILIIEDLPPPGSNICSIESGSVLLSAILGCKRLWNGFVFQLISEKCSVITAFSYLFQLWRHIQFSKSANYRPLRVVGQISRYLSAL